MRQAQYDDMFKKRFPTLQVLYGIFRSAKLQRTKPRAFSPRKPAKQVGESLCTHSQPLTMSSSTHAHTNLCFYYNTSCCFLQTRLWFRHIRAPPSSKLANDAPCRKFRAKYCYDMLHSSIISQSGCS